MSKDTYGETIGEPMFKKFLLWFKNDVASIEQKEKLEDIFNDELKNKPKNKLSILLKKEPNYIGSLKYLEERLEKGERFVNRCRGRYDHFLNDAFEFSYRVEGNYLHDNKINKEMIKIIHRGAEVFNNYLTEEAKKLVKKSWDELDDIH